MDVCISILFISLRIETKYKIVDISLVNDSWLIDVYDKS